MQHAVPAEIARSRPSPVGAWSSGSLADRRERGAGGLCKRAGGHRSADPRGRLALAEEAKKEKDELLVRIVALASALTRGARGHQRTTADGQASRTLSSRRWSG